MIFKERKGAIQNIDDINSVFITMETSRIRNTHTYSKCDDISILSEVAQDYITESINFRNVIGSEDNLIELNKVSSVIKSLTRKGTITDTVLENFINELALQNSNLLVQTIESLTVIQDDEYNTIASFNDINNTTMSDIIESMTLESDYIIECLIEMDIVTEGEKFDKVKTKSKDVVEKTVEKLKQFLTSVRNMFKSKIEKLRARDLQWLIDNKDTILKANVDKIEVAVSSDYTSNLNQMVLRAKQYKSAIQSIKYDDPKASEILETKTKKYLDSDGDLKDGLMNYYRTNSSKNKVSIDTLKGNDITRTLPHLHKYCIDFLNTYGTIDKELKDMEQKIERIKQEMKRRNVAEGFSEVENDFVYNTELVLCENFSILLEAENTDTKEKEAEKKDENGDKKVGVSQRTDVKDETAKLDNNGMLNYNKMFRSEHLGLTALLTAMEQKYFESIKILRGIK